MSLLTLYIGYKMSVGIDMDMNIIIIIMCMIVICLSPNIREILLVVSLCINAMSLTSGLSKLSRSKSTKKDTFVPQFENLSERNFDTMLYEEIPKPPSDIGPMKPIVQCTNSIPTRPMKVINERPNVPEVQTSYKGAIHYNDPMPMNDGNDRVVRLGLLHQGDKLARQLAGSSNIKKNMEIYLQNDVYEDEYRPWWGAYDI